MNALLTLGFKIETMADLIGGGLARVRVEVVNDSGLEIAVGALKHGGGSRLGFAPVECAARSAISSIPYFVQLP